MRRISLAIAAVSAASVVALTGCGSTSSPLGNVKLAAADAVAQTAQQAEAVNTYTVDVVADLSHPDRGAGKVSGRMVYQGKPQLAVDLTLDTVTIGENSLPGGVRAILLGDTAYVKLDALKSITGATKPWIKASVSDLDGGHQAEANNVLSQIQQFDLAAAVKLVTASKDVKAVGTENVGGTETTHYSGTFPVDEAVKLLDDEKQSEAAKHFGDVKDMKFDLWADAQNLPRKITMSGAAEGGTFNATMLFKGYNEPVEITAPPANEVGEIPNKTTN